MLAHFPRARRNGGGAPILLVSPLRRHPAARQYYFYYYYYDDYYYYYYYYCTALALPISRSLSGLLGGACSPAGETVSSGDGRI